MPDVPSMVKWRAPVIAGSGVARLTQRLTGMLRPRSTVLMGGLGNHVIATVKVGGALRIPVLVRATLVTPDWPGEKFALHLASRAAYPGGIPNASGMAALWR